MSAVSNFKRLITSLIVFIYPTMAYMSWEWENVRTTITNENAMTFTYWTSQNPET